MPLHLSMKLRSLFPGLLVTALFFLSPMLSRSAAEPTEADAANSTLKTEPDRANSNATPESQVAAPVATVTNIVNLAEVEELRSKLDALQHANDLALGRWSA